MSDLNSSGVCWPLQEGQGQYLLNEYQAGDPIFKRGTTGCVSASGDHIVLLLQNNESWSVLGLCLWISISFCSVNSVNLGVIGHLLSFVCI